MKNSFIFLLTRPARSETVRSTKYQSLKGSLRKGSGGGEFLAVNNLYGIAYATPRLPIEEALALKQYPVLDWPVNMLGLMVSSFGDRLFTVYVSARTAEILNERISRDNRDPTGVRSLNGRKELDNYWSSGDSDLYDLNVVSEDGKAAELAKTIYSEYRRKVE